MLCASLPVLAQPVSDLALSDAQLAVEKSCAILKVNFNIRIRYASHFPLNRGDELLITLNLIDRDQAAAVMMMKREATRVPYGKLAAIKAIVLEWDHPTGPVLRIQFDYPVAYQVAPNSDTRSIIVAISGKNPSAACRPTFPGDTYGMGPIAGMRRAGKITDDDVRLVAGWMDEGRAALKKSNYNAAIQIFTKILKYPENQYSAEAQELLGLARQKSGQLTDAKAEYEDYLRRYPSGEGSERVRQRLAGILTASGDPGVQLRAPNGQPPGTARLARNGETTWTFSGSASEFYVRNDSFRTVRDPSIAPDPSADPDAHRVHQNELLTNLDAVATWNNDQTKGKIRFSGSEEHRFTSESMDVYGVAALFVDTQVKDWNLRAVLGRQTLNTDGILGRFDGALLSWQALPWIRFDLVGGSPAFSRFDQPFKAQRYFYSAGVGFGPFFGGLETTLYAIEQRDRWLLDRQAVGAEFRYFSPDKFAFGTVDYDIHFQRLNAAIFSGSWTLPDQSTIYGGADYRRTPYLSTWNALLNQPFTTLYDMLRFQSNEQIQQLALDQTPTYKSAMIGFSHPLSDKLQGSADATVVNLNQPIVGVALDPSLATLPAGNEYYYSAQLIGSNVIKDGDMYVTALRYSQMTTANMYVVDINTRYPLIGDFRIGPRLRFGYRTGNGIDLKEYTALPSVLIDYYPNKNLNLEFEIGAQWTRSDQAGVRSTNTELFLTLGLRYDFYADDTTRHSGDKSRCGGTPAPVAAALCRYGTASERNNCATPPSSGR
jgi:tetratricopeptide (TPR) repeat protein